MAGLSNKPSMYDFSTAQDTSSNPLDEWAKSPDRGGHINLNHPNDVAYVTQAVQGIMNGQISEEGAMNLAQRVKGIAPHVMQALAQRNATVQSRNAIGQYFDPGAPATPDKPFTEQDIGSGVGPYQIGSPVQGTGTPAIPAKMDFDAAAAKAYQMGNYDLADKLVKAKKDMQGNGGLYGGVQYAQDPKTGQFVPYSIDERTRQPVTIQTPPGTVATVPLVPQAVAGPGGVSSIVQIASRGVPNSSGKLGTGLVPNHPQSMDVAGRLSMLDQANKDLSDAKQMMFKGGKLDKSLVAQMNVPFTAGIGEKPRMAASAIRNAIAAKLRAETGAQANDQEIDEIAKRFTPSILDTDKSAAYKMDRLQEYMNSAHAIVDPNGLFRKGNPSSPRQSVVPANSNTSTAPTALTPNQQRLKALLNGR